jgi:hypothetical protein
MNSIQECVDCIVTENRLKQGIDFLTEKGYKINSTATGPFIKWVTNDCIKEEKDTILENGLYIEDVCSAIARTAKTWFFKQFGK